MYFASYQVTGMHCGHCVASITDELRTLPGIVRVAVDRPTGRVDLTAERAVGEQEFRRVVEGAGFGVPTPVAG